MVEEMTQVHLLSIDVAELDVFVLVIHRDHYYIQTKRWPDTKYRDSSCSIHIIIIYPYPERFSHKKGEISVWHNLNNMTCRFQLQI